MIVRLSELMKSSQYVAVRPSVQQPSLGHSNLTSSLNFGNHNHSEFKEDLNIMIPFKQNLGQRLVWSVNFLASCGKELRTQINDVSEDFEAFKQNTKLDIEPANKFFWNISQLGRKRE